LTNLADQKKADRMIGDSGISLDFPSQCFFACLTGQTIVGLANSLFVLPDPNVALGLFGFYACFSGQFYALVCVCEKILLLSSHKPQPYPPNKTHAFF
jgi:hypothetical protein